MMLLKGQKLTMQGYDKWERESLKDEEHPYEPYNLTETSVIKYILPDGRTNVDSIAAEKACEKSICDFMSETNRPDGSIPNGRSTAKEKQLSGTNVIDFSGRLLGGCVDCLVNLTGTKYDKVTEFAERYKEDGILWFLEACDLNLMSIRRAMWQMEHAGWFRYCKGFLIGRPRIGMDSEEFGIDRYQAVYEMLRQYRVPVMMDLDIGHLPPMMPLICGSMARVVSDGRTYSVEMELR